MKKFQNLGITAFLSLVFFLLAILSIGTITTLPLWWDEGWTLTVARTWVEQGHYGMLLNGEPAPPGLSAAFPTVASVALSFNLFGVGSWQGRLPGVLYALASLLLLYYLTLRLYNQRIAITALAVSLLASINYLNPIYTGQQVLAEMPMIFFLLAGYVSFLLSLRKSIWFLPLAVVLWGIALLTKAQPLPFWFLSLFIPMFVSLINANRKVATRFAIALVGSLFAREALSWIVQLLLQGHTLPNPRLSGLYQFTALVLNPSTRGLTLVLATTMGLPTLLGLCYALGGFVKRILMKNDRPLEMVRLALFVLVGSWYAWYTLLSIGWPRYLSPAAFFGNIFVAPMLWGMAYYIKLPVIQNRTRQSIHEWDFSRKVIWQSIGALLVVVLIAIIIPITALSGFYATYSQGANRETIEVAHFLNTQAPPDALIESYESELFFLLDRPYHYPPNQLNADLVLDRLGYDVTTEYDPLAAEPDYLVVGEFSRGWELYEPILETGAFRFLQEFGRYEVYERVR